jgi:acyl-CoA thioester hydrolase
MGCPPMPTSPCRLGCSTVDGFSFSTDVAVRFAETDAQGIANNSVYLVWFEVARVAYLDEYAGGYPALRAQGIEAFVTEARVRYREPVRFADRLTINVRCVDVRGARFRFEYAIVRDADGAPVAEGETRHACVDGTTFRPTRVPEWLREAIAGAEAGN